MTAGSGTLPGEQPFNVYIVYNRARSRLAITDDTQLSQRCALKITQLLQKQGISAYKPELYSAEFISEIEQLSRQLLHCTWTVIVFTPEFLRQSWNVYKTIPALDTRINSHHCQDKTICLAVGVKPEEIPSEVSELKTISFKKDFEDDVGKWDEFHRYFCSAGRHDNATQKLPSTCLEQVIGSVGNAEQPQVNARSILDYKARGKELSTEKSLGSWYYTSMPHFSSPPRTPPVSNAKHQDSESSFSLTTTGREFVEEADNSSTSTQAFKTIGDTKDYAPNRFSHLYKPIDKTLGHSSRSGHPSRKQVNSHNRNKQTGAFSDNGDILVGYSSVVDLQNHRNTMDSVTNTKAECHRYSCLKHELEVNNHVQSLGSQEGDTSNAKSVSPCSDWKTNTTTTTHFESRTGRTRSTVESLLIRPRRGFSASPKRTFAYTKCSKEKLKKRLPTVGNSTNITGTLNPGYPPAINGTAKTSTNYADVPSVLISDNSQDTIDQPEFVHSSSLGRKTTTGFPETDINSDISRSKQESASRCPCNMKLDDSLSLSQDFTDAYDKPTYAYDKPMNAYDKPTRACDKPTETYSQSPSNLFNKHICDPGSGMFTSVGQRTKHRQFHNSPNSDHDQCLSRPVYSCPQIVSHIVDPEDKPFRSLSPIRPKDTTQQTPHYPRSSSPLYLNNSLPEDSFHLDDSSGSYLQAEAKDRLRKSNVANEYGKHTKDGCEFYSSPAPSELNRSDLSEDLTYVHSRLEEHSKSLHDHSNRLHEILSKASKAIETRRSFNSSLTDANISKESKETLPFEEDTYFRLPPLRSCSETATRTFGNDAFVPAPQIGHHRPVNNSDAFAKGVHKLRTLTEKCADDDRYHTDININYVFKPLSLDTALAFSKKSKYTPFEADHYCPTVVDNNTFHDDIQGSNGGQNYNTNDKLLESSVEGTNSLSEQHQMHTATCYLNSSEKGDQVFVPSFSNPPVKEKISSGKRWGSRRLQTPAESGIEPITNSGIDPITNSGIDPVTISGIGPITNLGIDPITNSECEMAALETSDIPRVDSASLHTTAIDSFEIRSIADSGVFDRSIESVSTNCPLGNIIPAAEHSVLSKVNRVKTNDLPSADDTPRTSKNMLSAEPICVNQYETSMTSKLRNVSHTEKENPTEPRFCLDRTDIQQNDQGQFTQLDSSRIPPQFTDGDITHINIAGKADKNKLRNRIVENVSRSSNMEDLDSEKLDRQESPVDLQPEKDICKRQILSGNSLDCMDAGPEIKINSWRVKDPPVVNYETLNNGRMIDICSNTEQAVQTTSNEEELPETEVQTSDTAGQSINFEFRSYDKMKQLSEVKVSSSVNVDQSLYNDIKPSDNNTKQPLVTEVAASVTVEQSMNTDIKPLVIGSSSDTKDKPCSNSEQPLAVEVCIGQSLHSEIRPFDNADKPLDVDVKQSSDTGTIPCDAPRALDRDVNIDKSQDNEIQATVEQSLVVDVTRDNMRQLPDTAVQDMIRYYMDIAIKSDDMRQLSDYESKASDNVKISFASSEKPCGINQSSDTEAQPCDNVKQSMEVSVSMGQPSDTEVQPCDNVEQPVEVSASMGQPSDTEVQPCDNFEQPVEVSASMGQPSDTEVQPCDYVEQSVEVSVSMDQPSDTEVQPCDNVEQSVEVSVSMGQPSDTAVQPCDNVEQPVEVSVSMGQPSDTEVQTCDNMEQSVDDCVSMRQPSDAEVQPCDNVEQPVEGSGSMGQPLDTEVQTCDNVEQSVDDSVSKGQSLDTEVQPLNNVEQPVYDSVSMRQPSDTEVQPCDNVKQSVDDSVSKSQPSDIEVQPLNNVEQSVYDSVSMRQPSDTEVQPCDNVKQPVEVSMGHPSGTKFCDNVEQFLVKGVSVGESQPTVVKPVANMKLETVTNMKADTVIKVKPDTIVNMKSDTVANVKPQTIVNVKPDTVAQKSEIYQSLDNGKRPGNVKQSHNETRKLDVGQYQGYAVVQNSDSDLRQSVDSVTNVGDNVADISYSGTHSSGGNCLPGTEVPGQELTGYAADTENRTFCCEDTETVANCTEEAVVNQQCDTDNTESKVSNIYIACPCNTGVQVPEGHIRDPELLQPQNAEQQVLTRYQISQSVENQYTTSFVVPKKSLGQARGSGQAAFSVHYSGYHTFPALHGLCDSSYRAESGRHLPFLVRNDWQEFHPENVVAQRLSNDSLAQDHKESNPSKVEYLTHSGYAVSLPLCTDNALDNDGSSTDAIACECHSHARASTSLVVSIDRPLPRDILTHRIILPSGLHHYFDYFRFFGRRPLYSLPVESEILRGSVSLLPLAHLHVSRDLENEGTFPGSSRNLTRRSTSEPCLLTSSSEEDERALVPANQSRPQHRRTLSNVEGSGSVILGLHTGSRSSRGAAGTLNTLYRMMCHVLSRPEQIYM